MSDNLETYGQTPFRLAVIHGGPGAAGSLAPLAKVLAKNRGVLEPLQTADSLQGQVLELKTTLEKHGEIPIILVGHSWGAFLSFILTARFPALVKKLILVGSGAFEEKTAEHIMDTRLSRLPRETAREVQQLFKRLENPQVQEAEKSRFLSRIGEILTTADTYHPMPGKTPKMSVNYHIYQAVWQEAARFRASGELLSLAYHIQCPVVAIHGDYDPHPVNGVKEPLSDIIKNFTFYLLKKCGHYPWLEKEACQEFYSILEQELIQK